MSLHNEWGETWIITQYAHGGYDHWPRWTTPEGKKFFHIHDARHHLAGIREGGWEILHFVGFYPPEDWVGMPHHHVNHNIPRSPKPEGFTAVGHVPADFKHK